MRTRARRYHQNSPLALDCAVTPNRNGARQRVELRSLVQLSDALEQDRIAAGNEYVVAAWQHPAYDAFHLLRALAASKDNLRESLPKRPVMIDLGVTQVLIRQIAEVVHRLLHAEASAPNPAQDPGDSFCCQLLNSPHVSAQKPVRDKKRVNRTEPV